eukprot:scaffold20749_cov109-Isochrysis_galbana.AAC.1
MLVILGHQQRRAVRTPHHVVDDEREADVPRAVGEFNVAHAHGHAAPLAARRRRSRTVGHSAVRGRAGRPDLAHRVERLRGQRRQRALWQVGQGREALEGGVDSLNIPHRLAHPHPHVNEVAHMHSHPVRADRQAGRGHQRRDLVGDVRLCVLLGAPDGVHVALDELRRVERVAPARERLERADRHVSQAKGGVERLQCQRGSDRDAVWALEEAGAVVGPLVWRDGEDGEAVGRQDVLDVADVRRDARDGQPAARVGNELVDAGDADAAQRLGEGLACPQLIAVVGHQRVLLLLPHLLVQQPLRAARADNRAEAEGWVRQQPASKQPADVPRAPDDGQWRAPARFQPRLAHHAAFANRDAGRLHADGQGGS